MLGVADPRVQARADPAPGVKVMQLLLGWMLGDEVGDSGGHDVRARFELRVERVEEVVAVAWIELPRVLSVQRDHHEEVAVALLLADPLQPPDERARRVDRGHALVVETNRIGDLRVAKYHRQAPAFALDALGAVQVLVSRIAVLHRAREYLFVADHPAETGAGDQVDHALAHCHLRRPHARRLAPEQPLEEPQPQRDLALGVLAMREVVFRQLDLRVGDARRVHVGKERKDRVVVGREGELDLPSVGELAVLGNDLLHHVELSREERLLVRFGEISVLALQLGEPRVRLHPDRVAPGEVEPHLEVANVLGRELRVDRPRRQLEIARRLLDPQRPRRLTHPAQQEVTLLGREVGRVPPAQVEEEVDRLLFAVVLDLRQQRRNEVEGGAELRIAVQEGRHLVVILGRSEPDPRQEVSAGEVVLVIGLVHVPDEGGVYGFHLPGVLIQCADEV